MVNCLVVQKRVCFGSPEFMFLRRDINIMLNQRDRLKCGHKLKYEENKERVDFLQNTIRALAGLVYFRPGVRKNHERQNFNAPASETYEEFKKRKRAEKEYEKKSKGKKSRKIVDNRQQVLPI